MTRVATFNIRTAGAPDGRNAWWLRRRAVVAAIRSLDADLIGLQEVQPPQLTWLEQHLGGDHEIVAHGRVGRERGERTVVLVRRPFGVASTTARWYSEEPDRPGSRAWGTRFPRFALLVRVLPDVGEPFLFASTHFDHASPPSRLRSGELLAEWVATDLDPARAVVVGDTNCAADDPSLRPLLGLPLRDALAGLPPTGVGAATFHRFRGGDAGTRMDQILVGPRWRVVDSGVVRDRFRGRFPSDHYPVVATLEPAAV